MAALASRSNPAAAASDNAQKTPPNSSLYLQNLPHQFQKDDLKRELYMLFSTYSPVIDVTVVKSKKMRGQAHVLFRDVQSATQAMRSCRGIEFFGREMSISYSRNRSATLAKLTRTVNQPVAAPSVIPTIAPPPSGLPPPPGTLPAPPGTLPAPPTGLPAPPTGLPPPPGLPGPPGMNGNVPPALKAPDQEVSDVASPQGTKRAREDSDEESDAAMDDDDDDEGGEMEMSDED